MNRNLKTPKSSLRDLKIAIDIGESHRVAKHVALKNNITSALPYACKLQEWGCAKVLIPNSSPTDILEASKYAVWNVKIFAKLPLHHTDALFEIAANNLYDSLLVYRGDYTATKNGLNAIDYGILHIRIVRWLLWKGCKWTGNSVLSLKVYQLLEKYGVNINPIQHPEIFDNVNLFTYVRPPPSTVAYAINRYGLTEDYLYSYLPTSYYLRIHNLDRFFRVHILTYDILIDIYNHHPDDAVILASRGIYTEMDVFSALFVSPNLAYEMVRTGVWTNDFLVQIIFELVGVDYERWWEKYTGQVSISVMIHHALMVQRWFMIEYEDVVFNLLLRFYKVLKNYVDVLCWCDLDGYIYARIYLAVRKIRRWWQYYRYVRPREELVASIAGNPRFGPDFEPVRNKHLLRVKIKKSWKHGV